MVDGVLQCLAERLRHVINACDTESDRMRAAASLAVEFLYFVVVSFDRGLAVHGEMTLQ